MNILSRLRSRFQSPRVLLRPRHRFPAEALEARIAPAANVWIGAASGSWSDPANWSDGVPTADDDVTIDPAGTLTITIPSGARVANSIHMPGDDTLAITGGSLTLTSESTISNLTFSSGTLNAGPLLTLTGSVVGQGGFTISGFVRNEGVVSLGSSINFSGTLENAGTINNAATVNLSGAAQINNLEGALFDNVTGVNGSFITGGAAIPGFFNAGTLRLSAATNTATGSNFNNLPGGIIEITSATTLTFSGAGTWEGADFHIGTGGLLAFTNGTRVWTGTFTGSGAGKVQLTGGSSLSGNITAGVGGVTLNFPDGFFEWTGGEFAGSEFTNTGTLKILSSSLKTILNNAGTINNAGRVTLSGAGQINNLEGALFDNVTGVNAAFLTGGAAIPGFFNAGTLRLSAATNTATASNFNNMPTGIIEVAGGSTLEFSGGGTWGGANFLIGTDGLVTLTNGTKNWTGTYTGSGAGNLQLTGGGSLSGNITAGVDGVTLNFPDGFFEWTGNGGFLGTTFTNIGTIKILGSPDLRTTLNNAGTINNAGRLDLSGTGQLNNLPGALFDNVTGVNSGFLSGGATIPGFFNAGTLRLSAATNTATGSNFNNQPTGIIEVTGGSTLEFSGNGTWGGGNFLLGTGGIVLLSNGTKEWTGTYTGSGAGKLQLNGGSSLSGNITAGAGGATFNFPDGFFEWKGNGQFLGTTFTNVGTIKILDSPDLKTVLNNAGTINNAGRLDFAGAGQLNNLAGALFDNVPGVSALLAAGNSSNPPGFFNAGTFRLSAGIAANTGTMFPAKMNNVGLVEVTAGTLQLTSVTQIAFEPVVQAGTWEVANGATLLFPLGAFQLTGNKGNLILHGTGTIGGLGSALTENSGSLQLLDGAVLTVGTGGFTNSGTLVLGSGSQLNTVAGLTLADTSRIEFQLQGNPASNQFGKLAVTGVAALNGVAAFVPATDYQGGAGDSYPLATFGSSTDDFSTFEGTYTQGTLFFVPSSRTPRLFSTALQTHPISPSRASLPARPARSRAELYRRLHGHESAKLADRTGTVDGFHLHLSGWSF